jgi:hypothetical protein
MDEHTTGYGIFNALQVMTLTPGLLKCIVTPCPW